MSYFVYDVNGCVGELASNDLFDALVSLVSNTNLSLVKKLFADGYTPITDNLLKEIESIPQVADTTKNFGELVNKCDSIVIITDGIGVGELNTILKIGTSASGHWGHEGRPGLVGGSALEDGSNISSEIRKRTTDSELSRYFKEQEIIEGDRYAKVKTYFKSARERRAAATAIAETHKSISESFPYIKRVLDRTPVHSIKIVGENNIERATKIARHYNSGGCYFSDDKLICVSRGAGTSTWDVGKLEIGVGNANYTGRGIFSHELGHHVHHNMLPSSKFKTDFRRAYTALSDEEVENGISVYAAVKAKNGRRKAGEGFAEAFCAYTHPEYGKGSSKRLDPRIEEVFNNHMPRS